jgi:AcrR family transcriptional regulator
MTREARREKWIEAGFAALARGGIEEVRVEVLAEALGVTKGGFYRSFADRRALIDAMLDVWKSGRVAAITKQAALDGKAARERLKALIELYSERINPEGMAIELAIRQWARKDARAGEAVAEVDGVRLAQVGELYRATGLDAAQAEAQALLFYAFIFGQSLMRLDRGDLIAECARVLTRAPS